jgi:small subunit ribosomal protein S21
MFIEVYMEMLLTRFTSGITCELLEPIIQYQLVEERFLVRVELRRGESQKQLLRRFKKKVTKSGRLVKARKKRWFVSRREKRRLEKKKAIRRIRRHKKNMNT